MTLIKDFPLLQSLININIIGMVNKLIEFLYVLKM